MMALNNFIFALSLFCLAFGFDPIVGSLFDHVDDRLSDNLIPVQYDLSLEPDLERALFEGEVQIYMRAKTSSLTKRLFIHADPELEILELTLTNRDVHNNASEIEVIRLSRDTARQLLVIEFATNVKISEKPELKIKFRGKIRDDGLGLFIFKDGDKKYLLSRFSPNGARLVFPCFDEPRFIALFKITLTVDSRLLLRSNNLMKITRDGLKNVHTSTFSRKIAPDELAFFLGDLSDDTFYSRKKPNIYLSRHYASENTKELIRIIRDGMFQMQTHFQQPEPYNGRKLDVILLRNLPAHFCVDSSGLIIMNDDNYLDLRSRQDFAERILIAIAKHSLRAFLAVDFTTKLWLYEGSALWFAVNSLDSIDHDFKYKTWFKINKLSKAKSAFSKRNHPQLVDKNMKTRFLKPGDPEQELANLKSYMIVSLLDTNCEGKLVRRYFNHMMRHAYIEATNRDYSDMIMMRNCGFSLDSFTKSWLSHPGIPLLQVGLSDEGGFKITQRVFYEGEPDEALKETVGWPLPINYKIFNEIENNVQRMFDNGNLGTEVFKFPPGFNYQESYIKFNPYGNKFFRVVYSKELAPMLLNMLGKYDLAIVDRYDIIDDALAAFIGGYSSAYDLLNVLTIVKLEYNHVLGTIIAKAFQILRYYFRNSEFESKIDRIAFGSLARLAFEKHITNFSKDHDEDLIAERREVTSELLVTTGDPIKTDMAINRFKIYSRGGKEYYENMYHTFIAVAKVGEPALVQKLFELYETNEQLRADIASALGFSELRAILNRALHVLQDDHENLVDFLINTLSTENGRKFFRERIMEPEYFGQLLYLLEPARRKELLIECCQVMGNSNKICADVEGFLREIMMPRSSSLAEDVNIAVKRFKRVRSLGLDDLKRFLSVMGETSES